MYLNLALLRQGKWPVAAMMMLSGLLAGACSTREDGRTEAVGVTRQALSEWVAGVPYSLGTEVSYQGQRYRLLQAHTSQSAWQPPNTPALWEHLGPVVSSPGSGSTPARPASIDFDYLTLRANCDESPESCCEAGAAMVRLGDGADVRTFSGPECILALGGHDTLYRQGTNPSGMILGAGDDTAMDGAGDDLIWGGPGRDTINGFGGTNLFFGGGGDDVLYAGNGQNTVIPGPGRDTVGLGNGNDTVYVFDLCEVSAGESLSGGGGNDKLVIPVPLAQLQALGVSVSGFEQIVVDANSCRSECVQKPDCFGRGLCKEGSVAGQVECECDAGWIGPSCSAPVTRAKPRPLPAPPREIGCYVGDLNGWHPVPCTARNDIDLPTPDIHHAIQSVTPAGASTPIPFEFGQVETTFVTFGSVTDTRDGADALSVQLNTNKFTNALGEEAVVQFVLQTEGFQGTGLCIWNINYTVACQDAVNPGDPCNNYDGYQPLCLGGSSFSDRVPFRPEGYRAYDFAAIGGSTYTNAAGTPVLGMVVQFSWVNAEAGANNVYAVVSPDSFGLRGRWTEVSGTALGMGATSQADFVDTSLLTRLLAGSCVNASGPVDQIPWAGVCPDQPELLPSTTLAVAEVTAETNNLLSVGGPMSLVSATKDLVFTQYLSSTTGACLQSPAGLYVRDSSSDVGVVPSNAGNEPFWESPDLFVVPEGTLVDVNAIASEAVMAPGRTYDIYVRVNNDYGCEPITGAKALVSVADPAALSAVWQPVTGGTYQDGANGPGVTVPAGGRALIGPLKWTAPTQDLGDGHKCLLAAIQATGQPGPANTFDAPGSAQVAQRNVQISACNFPLTNATLFAGNAQIILSTQGAAPSVSTGNQVGMTFEDPGATWYNVWVSGAGSQYAVVHDNGQTTVRLGVRQVALAPVPLGAGQSRSAEGAIVLRTNEPTTTLAMGAVFTNTLGIPSIANGGTCVAHGAVVK